jgi:hypothetical protein
MFVRLGLKLHFSGNNSILLERLREMNTSMGLWLAQLSSEGWAKRYHVPGHAIGTQRDDAHHQRDSRNRVIRPSSVTIPQPIVYQTAM